MSTSTANPRPYPFFKHVKMPNGDEFVMFSDGVLFTALNFADFDTERGVASLPAYPALDADSTGREYQQDSKHVQTFQGSNRNESAVPQERGGGDLNDSALDAYITNIASFTNVAP